MLSRKQPDKRDLDLKTFTQAILEASHVSVGHPMASIF